MKRREDQLFLNVDSLLPASSLERPSPTPSRPSRPRHG
jgi:hypothetical protein